MAEWELTDEEILAKSTDQFEYCELALEIGKWARDEQAKKLVKWLETPCLIHLHGRNNPKETSKHCRLCSTCMRELHRQVGLE